MSSSIITSASNKFFPSALNLIGSIKKNYPSHPPIYLYNLGLLPSFLKEINAIEGVTVLEIPHFVPHWRSCYTWKTYILNTPLADLNFYIDAGCEILKPLDEVFRTIDNDGYFAIEQGTTLERSTPSDYKKIFPIDEKLYQAPLITAGIFGFKKDSIVTPLLKELYDAGVQSLCLGFSPNEQWKNKGVNKNGFVRDCEMFRHDTTLLTLLLRKYIPELKTQSVEKYANDSLELGISDDVAIRNFRMNYRKLSYLAPKLLVNKAMISIFFKLKAINRMIKRLP